jgi:hypothetical protein
VIESVGWLSMDRGSWVMMTCGFKRDRSMVRGTRVVMTRALIYSLTPSLPSTAIGLGKYRIPSDLRSQAKYRLVSTMVGDHMGILGAVVFVR